MKGNLTMESAQIQTYNTILAQFYLEHRSYREKEFQTFPLRISNFGLGTGEYRYLKTAHHHAFALRFGDLQLLGAQYQPIDADTESYCQHSTRIAIERHHSQTAQSGGVVNKTVS